MQVSFVVGKKSCILYTCKYVSICDTVIAAAVSSSIADSLLPFSISEDKDWLEKAEVT
jgi:hypothetical protein